MLSNIKTINNIVEIYQNGQEKRKQIIQTALDSSRSMLNVQEFICATKFELPDLIQFDMIWQFFKQNIPIYMTDNIITMFGYSGPLYKQKDNIIKLTVKYNIRIIKYKNDEYQIFLNNCDMVVDDVDFSQLYPPITRTQLKSKPTHILIMPQDLKKLFYVVDTENGNMLREFFVKFDELLIIYSDYCVAYNNEHQPIKKLYTPKNELSPLNYISIESEPVDKDVCCSCSIQ